MAGGGIAPGSLRRRFESGAEHRELANNRIVLYLARRKLYYGPEEWWALPWYVRETYMEGFYTEELLQRPVPAVPDDDMSVPDDIRSLTAGGSEYRTAAAPEFDLGALIGDLEGRR